MGSKMKLLASVLKSSNYSGQVKYLNQRPQCFSSRPSPRGSWKKVPLSPPMECTWACSTTSSDTEIMPHNWADKGCPVLLTPWTMFQEKSRNVDLPLLARLSEPNLPNQMMGETIRNECDSTMRHCHGMSQMIPKSSDLLSSQRHYRKPSLFSRISLKTLNEPKQTYSTVEGATHNFLNQNGSTSLEEIWLTSTMSSPTSTPSHKKIEIHSYWMEP